MNIKISAAYFREITFKLFLQYVAVNIRSAELIKETLNKVGHVYLKTEISIKLPYIDTVYLSCNFTVR